MDDQVFPTLQREALDLVEQLASSDELRLDFNLEPGA